jgi:DNA-binding transcriptional MerR regulator
MTERAVKRDPEFLRITEAAMKLGVSVGTLRNWDRAGKLVPSRHPINGYRLYQTKELEGLLGKMRWNGK